MSQWTSLSFAFYRAGEHQLFMDLRNVAAACCLGLALGLGPAVLPAMAGEHQGALGGGSRVTSPVEQPGTASARESGPRLVVSHPGLLWLVRQLFPGATGSEAVSFVPAGASPETFEPTPAALALLNKADFFVASSVPYERAWLPRLRAAAPQIVIIEAFASELPGSQKPVIRAHHGSGHEHDPHLWSCPDWLREAAGVMVSAIGERRPQLRPQLEERRLATEAALNALKAEINGLLDTKAAVGRRPFFVFHPAWGAFAETFGLEQVALEDHGHAPGPAHMQKFVSKMKFAGAKTIFVQPQMSQRLAQTAAGLTGARLAVIDPLAEDLPAELRKFASELQRDFAVRAAAAAKKP